MPNFTDTPTANRFFNDLLLFEGIFRDELGPHYAVQRATLVRGRLGEYPGIHVLGHRLPEATMAHPLDLFFFWEIDDLTHFVNASEAQKTKALHHLRAHIGPALRSVLEGKPIDLEGASQAEAPTIWLELSGLSS